MDGFDRGQVVLVQQGDDLVRGRAEQIEHQSGQDFVVEMAVRLQLLQISSTRNSIIIALLPDAAEAGPLTLGEHAGQRPSRAQFHRRHTTATRSGRPDDPIGKFFNDSDMVR